MIFAVLQKGEQMSDFSSSEIPNSSDCISRQDAIEALIAEGRNVDSRYLESERIIHEADAVEVISMLPSAQPEKRTDKRTETHACDCISRQAAIDALNCNFTITGKDNAETVYRIVKGFSDKIKALPSAQPTLTNAESNTELSVDLISRADALSCFHDWIDKHGDVHTADEIPEYQQIEQLPSAEPEPWKGVMRDESIYGI
jgi:hypothetical protein